MSWKILEGVAALVYGALALILLFVFALWHAAFYGAAVAVLAAAMTYVFQAALLEASDDDGHVSQRSKVCLSALMAVVMALFALSFLLSIFGV